ncbi:MAG TPA: SDR family oxidoreductase [Kribbella sp.]|jgi:NAD(P)-dependent dehydrogenase (short-subunit alcohol dehydrogenase family)
MSEQQTSGGDVVVVTGAGQGIGYAIAERFSVAGATVIITDINEQTGSEAAGKLGGQFVQLDVSDSAAIARTADLVHQQHGRIDVLINNAGIAHEDDALDVTDEIWESVLAVDLRGTFVACREFGRYFIQQGGGSIVNISSIAAFMGTNPEYHVAYDVAKAGVSQLVRSLAVEWAQYGVRVNAVAPGRTRTPILDGVGLSDPIRMQQWIDQIPQRRLLSPQEIAEAVFFLGQEQSSAVTGQTLIVDGGQLAA